MYAKVKSTHRWLSVTAFGGHEYTKDEYRIVPKESEEAAKKHEMLDVISDDEAQAIFDQYGPVRMIDRKTGELVEREVVLELSDADALPVPPVPDGKQDKKGDGKDADKKDGKGKKDGA